MAKYTGRPQEASLCAQLSKSLVCVYTQVHSISACSMRKVLIRWSLRKGERREDERERGGEYNVFGCGLLGNDSTSILEVRMYIFATRVYTEKLVTGLSS